MEVSHLFWCLRVSSHGPRNISNPRPMAACGQAVSAFGWLRLALSGLSLALSSIARRPADFMWEKLRKPSPYD